MIPKIYCINLRERKDRRERMEKMFLSRKLNDKVVYIDAISIKSNLIEYYSTTRERPIVACFASHIKAIKTFLETEEEEALICEDDILLHNNFEEEYIKIRNNLPEDATLCALSYFNMLPWEYYKWDGKDKNKKNIFKIIEKTYGTQIYWISKKYAYEVISKYDRPEFGLSYHHDKVSEIITIKSGGYISYPVLAIEDCISSDIRDDNGMVLHVYIFNQWDYENYSLGDDGKSPLKRMDQQNIDLCINKLIRGRIINNYELVLKETLPLYEKIKNGLNEPLEKISIFLNELYISLFYNNNKNKAKEVVDFYMENVKNNTEFRDIFEKNKDKILFNFSFVSDEIRNHVEQF